jgi:hypothetical protein
LPQLAKRTADELEEFNKGMSDQFSAFMAKDDIRALKIMPSPSMGFHPKFRMKAYE